MRAQRRAPLQHFLFMKTAAVFFAVSFGLLLFVLFYNLPINNKHPIDAPSTTTASNSYHRFIPHLKSKTLNSATSHIHPHRIAVLLPFTVSSTLQTDGTVETTNDNVPLLLPTIPPYLLTFCMGAAAAADVADFLVIYTNGTLDQWPALVQQCPSNVHWINIGSHADLAQQLVQRILVADHVPPVHQAQHLSQKDLIQLLTTYLTLKPYALVEFKPALGHIFRDLIIANSSDNNRYRYSHWAYSDLDILFGDLGRWISADEWTDYDIVTYTFGDQQRLYLRGQFTMFRIIHSDDEYTVQKQFWRTCDYLSRMDDRWVNWLDSHEIRPESAEGCLSAAILNRTDVSVKFAVKAWTDIYQDDTVYSHGIFWARHNGRTKNHTIQTTAILYKADAARGEESGRTVSKLTPDWFERDPIYRNRQYPLQKPVGPRVGIDLIEHLDTASKCMYWVLPQYQTKLCLKDGAVSRNDTVFWINGKLYKQRYENALLTTPVVTAPFFHFQEWKRSYRFEQVAPLQSLSSVHIFVLTPEGVIPIVDAIEKPTTTPASPLRFSRLERWTAIQNGNRDQLPQNMYCLISGSDVYNKHCECKAGVTWLHNQTTIVGHALGWKDIDREFDVTLVLTLQISAAQAQKPIALNNVLDHLLVSLNRWRGQPSVVVVALASATQTTMELIAQKLDTDKNIDLGSSLIVVVAVQDASTVSRKALLNMAIDAVPTRWYLSGIEVERGLSYSVDTVFFAHRMAASHSHLRGNLFLVPQFGLVTEDQETTGSDEVRETISELHLAEREQRVKKLAAFEKTCDEDDMPGGDGHLASVDAIWWTETHQLMGTNHDTDRQAETNFSRRATSREELQRLLMKLSPSVDDANHFSDLDDSPIVLTDNLSPYNEIHTNEIAREVEALGGLRCYNGIRLKALAILGYSFDVLIGAFALSSESTRKAAQSGADATFDDRCSACSMFGKGSEDILTNIAKIETKRAAKTAIVWAESSKVKH